MTPEEMLGGSAQVIKHMLLASQVTRFVPFLAVFAAATEVRHDINSTRVEPDTARWVEGRSKADAITSVSVEDGWVCAIQFETLFAEDVQRDFRAIFGHCELAHDFHVIEIHG